MQMDISRTRRGTLLIQRADLCLTQIIFQQKQMKGLEILRFQGLYRWGSDLNRRPSGCELRPAVSAAFWRLGACLLQGRVLSSTAPFTVSDCSFPILDLDQQQGTPGKIRTFRKRSYSAIHHQEGSGTSPYQGGQPGNIKRRQQKSPRAASLRVIN